MAHPLWSVMGALNFLRAESEHEAATSGSIQ